MASDTKPIGQTVTELKDLTIAYARQETVDPLKNLGKYLGYGIGGALAWAVGYSILMLALLRVLQTETDVFDGRWSWGPYGIVLVAVAVGTFALYKKVR